MIPRQIEQRLKDFTRKYPIVALTGPRQSGKSTLLKYSFPDYLYISLEDLDLRSFAESDPRGFLSTYSNHVIIDEAQRVPSLFSYIQTHVDLVGECGMYVLSGSQNFLLSEKISQTLAGRVALLKLLPLSHDELLSDALIPSTIDDEIFYGGYPRLYDKQIAPTDYYPFYIQTYVERDVRMLKNIGDLSRFIRFVKLCAGRIGQLLNLSSLATEVGVSVPTISSWISVLEASYICYLLRPDWNNFSKRITKSPKLYFYDTGLACSLLDIHSSEQIHSHYLRGGLFENMVINNFFKNYWNDGKETDLRFWRDSLGIEIDLLDYGHNPVLAYEIKSGATFSTDYFSNLVKWASFSGAASDQLNVIYGGEKSLQTTNGCLIAW